MIGSKGQDKLEGRADRRLGGAKGLISLIKLLFYCSSVIVIYSLFPGDSFALILNSKAAVVIEASTGRVIYGKNPNLKLPPASTTKLMTAMVVLDKLDLNDRITISDYATNVSPIKANFHKGERVAVHDLLRAALIKSANDAAYALAEAVAGTEERFADLMNQKAVAIGMNDTRFVNSTGLPEEGQYITAYDLARMLRQALRYTFIREVLGTRTDRIQTGDGRTIFLRNSNKLLWEDESVIGGKTGYTRLAKHCFVCASENEGESIIVAILGSPSRETLWRESETLISHGFNILRGLEETEIFFDRGDYDGYVKKVSYKKKVGLRASKIKKIKKKAKQRNAKLKSKHYASKKKVKSSIVKGGNGIRNKG